MTQGQPGPEPEAGRSDVGSGPNEGSGASPEDLLAGVRRLAGLARDLGVSDLSNLASMIDEARQEGRGPELFRSLKSMVDQFMAPAATTRPTSGSRTGGEPGPEAADGTPTGKAGTGASASTDDDAAKAEQSLLRRIDELARTATIEGVVDLAGAYAQIRAAAGGGHR